MSTKTTWPEDFATETSGLLGLNLLAVIISGTRAQSDKVGGTSESRHVKVWGCSAGQRCTVKASLESRLVSFDYRAVIGKRCMFSTVF